MNSFLFVLVKYLAFLSGRNAEQLGGDLVSEGSENYNVYASTTSKSTHTTGEYYDYELDTAPTVAPKTVTTTTEEVRLVYDYEETTISYKDYVTDVYGDLVTRRLSRKKKRKRLSPYIKIDEADAGFYNIATTTELVTENQYEELWSYIPPIRNRTRCPKTTDVIQVPDPTFSLLYPAGFIILLFDTKTVWPVMILWSVNKHDVSKEISSIRGFFFRDLYINRWVHDNDEQTFSKNDVFRYMIKYGYRRPASVTEHFRRYYTVNISKHYGKYYDREAAFDKVNREKLFVKNRDRELRFDFLREQLATPVRRDLPPGGLYILEMRRMFRARGRRGRRLALIRRINQAKFRLGITESTFITENVTTKRFRRYFAVGGYQCGFGYLRSHNKQGRLQFSLRPRYRRYREQPINEQLAKRLGIRVPPTRKLQTKRRKKDKKSKKN